MSHNLKNSFFNLLPNEILINILQRVDTFSLLCFCEVYECDFFFQDRNVIKNINLSREYRVQDLRVLSKKIAFERVTVLNINCMYWIPPSALRKFVEKLVNLEELYAIKTNLSITSVDIEIYNKTKIEKLGVSVRKNDDIGFSKSVRIKTLYINLAKLQSFLTFNNSHTLDMHFPQLMKIWIEVEDECCGRLFFNYLGSGSKYKIFSKVTDATPSISKYFFGLERYYNNRISGDFFIMCCEKFGTKKLHVAKPAEVNEDVRKAWETLNELHCPLPYGPRDARRLYLNEATLDDISFEELNFSHTGPTCNCRCRSAYKQILRSKNAKTIKRLCMMTCMLIVEANTTSAVTIEEPNGFKRKRIGLQESINCLPAEDLLGNVANLEHLEIFACPQSHHSSYIQAYPLIANFEKLQTLVVEVPITLSGNFLVQVLKDCKCLECLKVKALAHHENLNHNLCKALPFASSLKDFRYENHRIPLDRLLECLCVIKSQKMQRLVLICNEIDKFSAGPLKDLLTSNPQLIFLYFLVRKATENALKKAQYTLNDYKKQHPAKVFFAKKTQIGEIGFPIPEVHFCEMIKFESDVATLRPLENFTTF